MSNQAQRFKKTVRSLKTEIQTLEADKDLLDAELFTYLYHNQLLKNYDENDRIQRVQTEL